MTKSLSPSLFSDGLSAGPGRSPKTGSESESLATPTAFEHPPIKHGKIGVLIVNLGTPDATSYWPMRRYLKEFLSDRRVIEVNPVKWWFILNGPVLTKRPFSSGDAYRAIWNEDRDESPLRTITRHQSEKLEEAFHGESAHHRRLGDALRQSVHRLAARRPQGARLRAHSRWCRSIRNIPPQRPRPCATRLSTR